MSNKVVYPGKDLEAMDFAVRYHQWILKIFRPFLGKNVVEVGAGTGSVSEMLLRENVESLALVEPSEEMFPLLEERVRNWQTDKKIQTYNDIFTNVAAEIGTANKPDTMIYVNVLEHIEDDARELEAMLETLTDGGRILIFVPSLPRLFSNFDKQIGHFRRYTKRDLTGKTERAGFKILRCGYFDFVGMFPWWLKYRVMKSTTMQPGALKLYDQLVVPLAQPLETLIPPPIGKNLILIAEKS
jgi:SAM-dependent methyltransferase